MSIFTLKVYSGDRVFEYEVMAEFYEPDTSGCYTFYVYNEESILRTVVAAYPICRTVIAKIENQNK